MENARSLDWSVGLKYTIVQMVLTWNARLKAHEYHMFYLNIYVFEPDSLLCIGTALLVYIYTICPQAS